jgi:hypothetical protein
MVIRIISAIAKLFHQFGWRGQTPCVTQQPHQMPPILVQTPYQPHLPEPRNRCFTGTGWPKKKSSKVTHAQASSEADPAGQAIAPDQQHHQTFLDAISRPAVPLVRPRDQVHSWTLYSPNHSIGTKKKGPPEAALSSIQILSSGSRQRLGCCSGFNIG